METTLQSPHKGKDGATQEVLKLQEDLLPSAERDLGSFNNSLFEGRIVLGSDSLWIKLRRGMAGYALRIGYGLGAPFMARRTFDGDRLQEYVLEGAFGTLSVRLELVAEDPPVLRAVQTLRPRRDLILTYWPRDLYPFAESDPAASAGEVHCAQHGLNAGIVYATYRQPRVGSFLYLQDFGSLQSYFEATEKKPDGVVGGQWPELGYLPPVNNERALPGNQETTVSDAYLVLSEEIPEDVPQVMETFIKLLAEAYLQLRQPETALNDWPKIARRTTSNLENAATARVRDKGYTYLRPYNDAEYPDSMCQLNIVQGLHDYALWLGKPLDLESELTEGVGRFYNRKLGSLQRYLPTVGKDKDPNEVDSWYLYHPLMSLGKLALEGSEQAKKLFLDSIDYAVKAAQKFEYRFPVLFDATTLQPKRESREPGQPGQSDCAGLYAFVMAQGYELAGEGRFLEEAKKALTAIERLGFNLAYQMNITAIGLTACIRVFRATGEEYFVRLAHNFAGSFFQNVILWDSDIGHAKHFQTFMGATCLHDGPYMSMFECHESFEALTEALIMGGDDLPEPLRLLLAEYCKFTMTRAWSYYPAHLPKDALATEIRNGHIDRKLFFPLEDLYADGQPAGQVGQEIYGCAAPYAILHRAFHRLGSRKQTLCSEYPLADFELTPDRASARIVGSPRGSCALRLLRKNGDVPELRISGKPVEWSQEEEPIGPCLTARANGGAALELSWKKS